MYERAMTFSEYVAFYALTRSEGVVLRYFADAYRALRRTVPTSARTEELTDITSWLGELVRGVDSSLLDEWEALAHPDPDELGLVATGPRSGRRSPPAGSAPTSAGFTVMVRNAMFRRVELVSLRPLRRAGRDARRSRAGGRIAGRDAMDDYWDEYDDLGIGAAGPGGRSW